jgi:hypothetical protein
VNLERASTHSRIHVVYGNARLPELAIDAPNRFERVQEPLRNRSRIESEPALLGGQEQVQKLAAQDRKIIEKTTILFGGPLGQARNDNRAADQFGFAD